MFIEKYQLSSGPVEIVGIYHTTNVQDAYNRLYSDLESAKKEYSLVMVSEVDFRSEREARKLLDRSDQLADIVSIQAAISHGANIYLNEIGNEYIPKQERIKFVVYDSLVYSNIGWDDFDAKRLKTLVVESIGWNVHPIEVKKWCERNKTTVDEIEKLAKEHAPKLISRSKLKEERRWEEAVRLDNELSMDYLKFCPRAFNALFKLKPASLAYIAYTASRKHQPSYTFVACGVSHVYKTHPEILTVGKLLQDQRRTEDILLNGMGRLPRLHPFQI